MMNLLEVISSYSSLIENNDAKNVGFTKTDYCNLHFIMDSCIFIYKKVIKIYKISTTTLKKRILSDKINKK